MKKRNILKRNSGFIIGCVLAGGASFFTADALMTDMIPDLQWSESESEEPESTTAAVLEPEKQETVTYETDPFTITASGSIIKGVESEAAEEETKTDTLQSEDSESDTSLDGTESGGSGTEGETSVPGSAESGLTDSGSEGSSNGDSSGDGSYSEGSSSDGSYSDGSYSDGGSSDGSYSDGSSSDGSYSDGGYDQVIEIQDPGNGDYTYSDDSSWSDDSWSDGSGDDIWIDDSGSDDGSWSDNSGDTDGAWTPDEVILWGISSRYIDESELYNYDAGQLRLIRNEIFALNGRIFRSQDLADYFSQRSWYVPTYDPDEFDANMFYYLNDYEEANLQVILDYEDALAGY